MTPNEDMEKQPLLSASQQGESQQPTPSLSELQNRVFAAQREYMKAWSKSTSGKWHRRIMFGTTAILLMFMAFCFTVIAQDSLVEDDNGGWMLDGRRVPLEAHIMSKCPDARDCLHDLILPAMQQVSTMVDFKLSYIGRETDHDDGVACMHGQEECLGNLIELCAAKLYADPKIYLGFTMCLSREYSDIPKRTLIEDCALEHGIDMTKLNECTADEEGSIAFDLLKDSFRRSQAANVTTSCTVRLNNEVRCIRDGGSWKNCEGGSSVQDLVKDIRNLYNA